MTEEEKQDIMRDKDHPQSAPSEGRCHKHGCTDRCSGCEDYMFNPRSQSVETGWRELYHQIFGMLCKTN